MNIDPSCVSRMLSGERDAALQHVKAILGKCSANPDLVIPLWEAANGVHSTTDPVLALRVYLRALHYAAGSPSDTKILTTAQRVRQLTVAFQSLPETTRPLWRKAHSTAGTDNTVPLPAAAFG